MTCYSKQPIKTDDRQKVELIECTYIYMSSPGISPAASLGDNYTLCVSVGIMCVYLFIYNRETSKSWTKIPFNKYVSSVINCAFLILCFSWCLQRDVPFELCLSHRLCHPKLRDSFNCNMTTTRNAQNPHKCIEKLAAFPMRATNHGVITGKQPLHLRQLYGEGDCSIYYVWSQRVYLLFECCGSISGALFSLSQNNILGR